MNRQILTSQNIRKGTIMLSCRTKAGHLAPSLSCIEILTVLFRDFMKFSETEPQWEERDRLVFSKGHGAYGYYVILNRLGIIPDSELDSFYTPQSSLKGCLVMDRRYMLEASTGALGHGLPIAVGMALAMKIRNRQNKIVCVLGDGEMQEGSNFEALQMIYRHKLNNLLIIVDGNGLQAMDKVEDVGLDNDKLSEIMSGFVAPSAFFDIDGHDEDALKNAFGTFFEGKPDTATIVFCRTVKGKGVEMMENQAKYHFRCPTEDGYNPHENCQ